MRPEAVAELPTAEVVAETRRQRDTALDQRNAALDELRTTRAELRTALEARDEALDLLARIRKRYRYGVGEAIAQLRRRPELEHTHHRAA